MKKLVSVAYLSATLLLLAPPAYAHVTVKPIQAGIASYQTFTVAVPSEREMATVSVRLVIPDGFSSVTPTVKPGWKAEVKKDGDTPKEILWTAGSIPGEFRDEFTFSAKLPSSEGTVTWKAYQTYKDGAVVAWELAPDQQQPKKPDGSSDFSQFGPASQTKVINDLQAAPAPQQREEKPEAKNVDALTVSLIALAVSAVNMVLGRRKNS